MLDVPGVRQLDVHIHKVAYASNDPTRAVPDFKVRKSADVLTENSNSMGQINASGSARRESAAERLPSRRIGFIVQ